MTPEAFARELVDLLCIPLPPRTVMGDLSERIRERDAVLAGPKPESDPGGVDEGALEYRRELPTLTEVDNPNIILGED